MIMSFPSYKEAQTYPEKRQEYLDSRFQEIEHLARSLTYDHKFKHLQSDLILEMENSGWDKIQAESFLNKFIPGSRMSILNANKNFGLNKKLKIMVSDYAFLYDENIFDNILFDHECFHIKDAMKGFCLSGKLYINKNNIALVRWPLFHEVFEIRAYNNQLNSWNRKGFDNPEHVKDIHSGLDSHTERMQKFESENPLEEILIDTTLNL